MLRKKFVPLQDGDAWVIITSEPDEDGDIKHDSTEELYNEIADYIYSLFGDKIKVMNDIYSYFKNKEEQGLEETEDIQMEINDNKLMVAIPGVDSVEAIYLPSEHAVEIETGKSVIPSFSHQTFTINLPRNKYPESAKLIQGVLVINLKEKVRGEPINIEVE